MVLMPHRIVVLAGDGVGPEVTAEALRVLRAVGEQDGIAVEVEQALIGGAAIDATGDPFPQATRALVATADAVLLGAVGGPRWSAIEPARRPERGLLALRQALGTFANLRPVRTLDALADQTPLKADIVRGTDILFVRELTGGAYFGAKMRGPAPGGGEVATDDWRYSTAEIERIARVAGHAARQRRGRVTSVDKANVLATSQLWRDVVSRCLADEFPEVTLEHAYVDAFAMQLLTHPTRYDVVVAENLFGDILTDEAAVLAGSIGLLPSASLGTRDATGVARGLYEPIHGSAPDIAGRGIANPLGAIASVAMLLRDSLGRREAGDAVEGAIRDVVAAGIRTADCAAPGVPPVSTRAMGDAVLEALTRTLAAR
jgi:3-isopropylmalate dehydrogenase